jgi:hypothetical protein
MMRRDMRQPARPPAAEDSPHSVFGEILLALQEMFPERDGLRDLAGRLSEEYMRERGQAMQDLYPRHPTAPLTDQMLAEKAYDDQQSQERQGLRMERRLKDMQKQDERDARKYSPVSRPPMLRPPGAAQGIAPSVQYGSPLPATGSNQPAIPRAQGPGFSMERAAMLDRLKNPYPNRPSQPPYLGPVERTYRA